MTSILVIIGTYGDRAVWGPQAERALSSVENQSRPPLEAKIVHLDSLHEARNSGAESASGEWLCFLDADDLLAPDYLASMTQSITENAVQQFCARPAGGLFSRRLSPEDFPWLD